MATDSSNAPDDDNDSQAIRVEAVDVEGGGQILIATQRDGSPIDFKNLIARFDSAERPAHEALASQWRDMTIGQLQRALTSWLHKTGIDDAAHDSRSILQAVLEAYELNTVLNASTPAAWTIPGEVAELAMRRAAREPLSHIIGSVGFWTLDLIVTPDVLTPRPDTETIVEAALAAVPDRSAPLDILDIATGSGAIALALLSELPRARAVATDLSPAALAVARTNADRNRLSDRITFLETSWAEGVDGPFDLVVSNPPYIASAVIDTLEPEVRDHEPRMALDGGPDGLAPYPHLFAEARRLIKPGGTGVFEIGYDQGEAALSLARAAGFEMAELRRDLAGRDRAVVFGFD